MKKLKDIQIFKKIHDSILLFFHKTKGELAKTTFSGYLSAATFVISGLLLAIYFWPKLSNNRTVLDTLNFSTDDSIFWILIIFIILGNLSLFENVLAYVLKDRFDKMVSDGLNNKLDERIKLYIKDNAELISSLTYSAMNAKSAPKEEVLNINNDK